MQRNPPAGYIPAEVIAPYLPENLYGFPEVSRVSKKTLYDLRNGVKKYVSFNTADRLLCKQGLVWKWQTDPVLKEWYYKVDLREKNRSLPDNPGLCSDLVCRNGHQRTEENTYITPRGKRQCRICKRDRHRRYREEE